MTNTDRQDGIITLPGPPANDPSAGHIPDVSPARPRPRFVRPPFSLRQKIGRKSTILSTPPDLWLTWCIGARSMFKTLFAA